MTSARVGARVDGMRKTTKGRSLDVRALEFGNIRNLVKVDHDASPAVLRARHETLMARLLARAQAKGQR